MIYKFEKGQSILEVVFSMGLISLVAAGVVMLVATTLESKKTEVDRKKVVEISQSVLAAVEEEKINDAVNFWNPSSTFWQQNQGDRVGQVTLPNIYPGYDYSVSISQDTRPGCSSTTWECANVMVTVGYSGLNERQVFTRFFSRK